MSDIVLYHVPPSFYSQIARMVLCELGVDFDARLAPPGPPTFDSYQPWYLKLNPMGTVPTMVHGDQAVPDSDAIMRYAAEHLSSVQLEPEEPERKQLMERWIDDLRAISIRELSYGAEQSRAAGAKVNKMRLKVLAKRRDKYPELAEVYANKIDDIAGFAERSVDPEVTTEHRRHVDRKLAELNATLTHQAWITGDSYTFADAVWTVAVARFIMLHLDPLAGRPALTEWYSRVKARPSFAQADIWESFQILSMLQAISKRFRGQLLAGAAGVAGLVWWWCSTCGT